MRILFLYDHDSTFVRADLEILRGFAEVTAVLADPSPSLAAVARSLSGHDLAYAWFGLGHATRAVLAGCLLRRPSVVVGGGWDVADMPEIQYGAARGTYGRGRACMTFGLASRVLAFSKWSADQIRTLAPWARVETIYLGVATHLWQPVRHKEPIVLTIGQVSEPNLRRKGLEAFAKASALVPEARFVVVGKEDPAVSPSLRAIGGSNLELAGEVPDALLRDLAGRSSVYVQVSYTEGFGLALAEAMSAECVPVVTNAGAIPEVVGDCGFYVPYGNPEATGKAIRTAFESGLGPRARLRIKERFRLENRATQVRHIVDAVTTSRGGSRAA